MQSLTDLQVTNFINRSHKQQMLSLHTTAKTWTCIWCIHYNRYAQYTLNIIMIMTIYKKLQAIYLMLYKRYKTAKIKKYKH